jgi:hypothetical protein
MAAFIGFADGFSAAAGVGSSIDAPMVSWTATASFRVVSV